MRPLRPPEACESLEDVRGAIDGLDREVLRLLGSRARYVATAARFKTDPKGHAMMEDHMPEGANAASGFAVTLEREPGEQSPKGAMFLVSAAS